MDLYKLIMTGHFKTFAVQAGGKQVLHNHKANNNMQTDVALFFVL